VRYENSGESSEDMRFIEQYLQTVKIKKIITIILIVKNKNNNNNNNDDNNLINDNVKSIRVFAGRKKFANRTGRRSKQYHNNG